MDSINWVVQLLNMCSRRLLWPLVNLGIETSASELELKLELILQALLFPAPWGLWTPNIAEWWLRMRGPHPQSYVILRYHPHVKNKKCYISTFTRSMYPKSRRMVTYDEGTPPTRNKLVDPSISLFSVLCQI